MFRELPRYATTRRTTLPWAVDIPSHWQVGRAKSIMRALDVRSAAGEEELLTVSSSRGVVPRSSAQVNMFKAESYAGHKLCWPGDLVINSLWAWGRGLGVAQHHGIVSTAYGVYRQHGRVLNADYLHQLVRSEPFQWELQVRSQGVWKSRLQITDDRWLDAPLLVPAHEEQAAIVKYLAHANARIDKAIAAKRRLIALLNELAASVQNSIVTAVTEGDEIVSIGQTSSLVQTGPFGSQLHAEEYVDNGIPIINPAHIGALGVMPDPSIGVSPEKAEELRRHRFETGDIVLARRGDLGRCAVVQTEQAGWLCGTGSLIVRLHRDRWNPEYFQMAFSSKGNKERLQLSSVGSTMANLNASQIARMRLQRPPLARQEAAVLEMRSAQADHASRLAMVVREIALLQEFRTRLIADVVTGQVDVRAIAASLPDNPEQDTHLDALLDDDLEDELSEGEE